MVSRGHGFKPWRFVLSKTHERVLVLVNIQETLLLCPGMIEKLLTRTSNLSTKKRNLILIFIAGRYDARSRMLVKHVAWQLRVSWDEVEDIETELAKTLEYNTYVMSE